MRGSARPTRLEGVAATVADRQLVLTGIDTLAVDPSISADSRRRYMTSLASAGRDGGVRGVRAGSFKARLPTTHNVGMTSAAQIRH
jgi:hypothetical protein